jgi:hypothetical protein
MLRFAVRLGSASAVASGLLVHVQVVTRYFLDIRLSVKYVAAAHQSDLLAALDAGCNDKGITGESLQLWGKHFITYPCMSVVLHVSLVTSYPTR